MTGKMQQRGMTNSRDHFLFSDNFFIEPWPTQDTNLGAQTGATHPKQSPFEALAGLASGHANVMNH